MSIVSVNEDFKGRTGNDSLTDGQRVIRTFVVVTDDKDTAQPEIFVASDGTTAVPRKGDAWTRLYTPDEPAIPNWLLTVRNVRVTPKDNSLLVWNVVVEYTDRTLGPFEDPDPRNRPAREQWGFLGQNEEFIEDESMQPQKLVNSAGVPYDPFPTREAHHPILRLTWNVATFSPQTAWDFRDAVNEDTFQVVGFTIPAGTAKMSGMTGAGPNVENGIRYYEQMVELKFRDDWLLPLESWGFRSKQPKENEGDELELKDIITKRSDGSEGQPQQPLALNAEGRHEVGGVLVSEPHRVIYQSYKLKPFNNIQWPITR
jgi:hypothetical protein